MSDYDFKKIEEKWQKRWEEENYGKSEDFSASPAIDSEVAQARGAGRSDKPKHYHLVEFPYPSGAGLHVGHCMGYGASDAYCRMKRMQGFNVMYPIGWDAFGLPTENYAIKNKIKPQRATEQNVATFKTQMKSLGLSFDWSREINTTDPDYYRWTQWIFLQFYKHGIVNNKLVKIADDDHSTPRLAFQAEMPVNWCPSCKTNLANEEVIAGACERCGTQTEVRLQKQWMLRITAYADRLIEDLDSVDYLDKIKTQQINWIGRSEGVIFKEKVKDLDINFEVYDSVPQTFVAQTFTVIAPEHPLVNKLVEGTKYEKSVLEFVDRIKKKKRQNKFDVENDIEGIFTGRYIENPFGYGDLEIWVASYVVADYGTGIVNCSAHDERDFTFAKKYNIPLRIAMLPPDKELANKVKNFEVYFGHDTRGIIQIPNEFEGMTWSESREKIIEYIEKNRFGRRAVQFKLRDWIFSRQHYWGEPIPVVYCANCAKTVGNNQDTRNDDQRYAIIPVPEDQLPIKLPDVENYEPTNTGESPLAAITDWVETICPRCGGKAKRETDTMPNWAGSSWYFLAYSMNQELRIKNYDNKEDIFSNSQKELRYWTPTDIYNGGMEHTTLHLLYSRFWHKFLFDLGVVPGSEPYAKRIAHGIILGPDGRKMSKSFGNVINPDEIVKQYGADTLRMYIAFIGPYDQESAWNMAGVQGVSRFLKRVWNNIGKINDEPDKKELLIKLNQTIKGLSEDLESFRLNTAVAKLMEFNNLIEKVGRISKESFSKFLVLLYPLAPHITSELWELAENKESIEKSDWPGADPKYLVADMIEIVVQINGKVREKLIVSSDITDEELKSSALESPRVKEITTGKEIMKVIVIPKKLLSIVIK